MKTIILSPHFDDAAFSCGGWIADMVQLGESVEVWTICNGLPPDDQLSELGVQYHQNWGLTAAEVIETRLAEDKAAMDVLGIPYRYFSVIDALYRRHLSTGEFLYPDEDSLFGGLHPGDGDILRLLAAQFTKFLPEGEFSLVSPLTVGNHVDHLLVRAAVEQLPFTAWYYPDYPYTREHPEIASILAPPSFVPRAYPVSEQGLSIWQESIAAYSSQISSFWPSLEGMRAEVLEHMKDSGGVIIWQPGPGK